MNNGVKAEENTPSEASLQEEEVRGGSVRRRGDLGRRPRAGFLRSAGEAGGARGPGMAPDGGPGRVSPRRECFCGCVPKIA